MPLAEALEECGEHGVAADAWRRLGPRERRVSRVTRASSCDGPGGACRLEGRCRRRGARGSGGEAGAAGQGGPSSRAVLAPLLPQAPMGASLGNCWTKIENAATAPPRRADTSSEAAAPPSVASKVSRATSAATSAIAVSRRPRTLSERMVEREIARRDLQEAKKYGARRSMPGRSRVLRVPRLAIYRGRRDEATWASLPSTKQCRTASVSGHLFLTVTRW